MSTVRTAVSAEIDASPAAVYAIFADYRKAHPQILPKPYFGEVVVEAGGTGAGTVFRTSMTVMGRTIDYHMVVTEPEPGRVLMETDAQQGVVTTFTVEPIGDGARSRVEIATEWTPSQGVMGWIEKLSTPGFMRKLYKDELQNVQVYVQTHKAAGDGGFE